MSAALEWRNCADLRIGPAKLRTMRTRYWLIALVLVHLGLGLTYAAITPYRTPGIVDGRHVIDIGAPDEIAHSNYILYMAAGRGFPVLRPEGREREFEYHQPPLYYALAAAWGRVFGPANLTTQSAGVILRVMNVLFGCCTVVGAFFIGWWGLKSISTGLCAAGLCAMLPMECAVSGALSNDPLLIALCTWTVALAVKAAMDGWNARTAPAIGLLAGAALLTKSSGLAMLPVIAAAWWWAPDRRSAWRLALGALIVAVLLVLPWWLRNQAIYGDPLARHVFRDVFPPNVDAGGLLADTSALRAWFLNLCRVTGLSFLGVFGYMHILLPQPVYALFALVFCGLALGSAHVLQDPSQRSCKPAHAVNAACVLWILAFYIAFNLEYIQPQARYLFPALGPIAVALSMGPATWARHRRQLVTGILAAGLLAVNAMSFVVVSSKFHQNVADLAAARIDAPR